MPTSTTAGANSAGWQEVNRPSLAAIAFFFQSTVQSALTSPGANVTPTVISISEANPTVSETALRTALNVLGAGTGAAATLITSFAQDIGNVADCADGGSADGRWLQAVLKDPGFSTLAANNPNAVTLAQTSANSIGVTTLGPTGTPTPTAAPPTTTTTLAAATPTTPAPALTFGNFGSIAGTGASTSPAAP